MGMFDSPSLACLAQTTQKGKPLLGRVQRTPEHGTNGTFILVPLFTPRSKSRALRILSHWFKYVQITWFLFFLCSETTRLFV